MSEFNKRLSVSIFNNQDTNDLKERKRLEELQRQAKIQQVKLDKRLNKQKILMGAFLGQVLASDGDDEKMIQDYFAMNFPDFLTRSSDRYLFKSMVESLGGDMGLDKEVDPFVLNTKESKQKVVDQSVTIEDSQAINNQQLSFDATNHEEQNSLLNESGYSNHANNQIYRG